MAIDPDKTPVPEGELPSPLDVYRRVVRLEADMRRGLDEIKQLRKSLFRGIHVFVSGSDWEFYRPVYPGDILRCESEVLEKIPSRSKPDRGVVRVLTTVINQDDAPVMTMIAILIIRTRPDDPA